MIMIFFWTSLNVYSQLNMPESVIFDTLYNRYLVSNYGSGSIIQIDSIGNESVFVNQMNATQGLEIVDSIIYVGCDSTVRGFHLATGAQVMNLKIEDVENLNDVTSDNNGHLFVTDVFGEKIIKVYLESQMYSTFVEGNGILNPNGIIFDNANNRLLVCSYRPNFPIQQVDLIDSTVSTILETNLHYSDGITIDEDANVYFTSWSTKAIYKLNNNLSDIVEVYQNDGGPADIFYDKTRNQLVIPLQQINSIDFLPLNTPTYTDQDFETSNSLEIDIFPSPSNSSLNTVIEFFLPYTSNISLLIYDNHGILIKELFQGKGEKGKNRLFWDGTGLYNQIVPNGVYYFNITTDYANLTRKTLVIN